MELSVFRNYIFYVLCTTFTIRQKRLKTVKMTITTLYAVVGATPSYWELESPLIRCRRMRQGTLSIIAMRYCIHSRIGRIQ